MLKDALSLFMPNFVSLSEPQLFQCDLQQVMQHLEGEYCCHLNSDDLIDPELPLVKSKAHGGTMMLWSRQLDPYIEVISTSSSAFLPIIFKMPGLRISIHVTIYLPTHGKDSQFVSDLADLRNCLDELVERFTDPIIYVRGDGNVNPNNTVRVILLQQFIQDYSLVKTELAHNTYHHFVGNGKFDSMIDILLNSSEVNCPESVLEIMCKHDHPAMLSHHDIIVSQFSIPVLEEVPVVSDLISAPKLDHTRVKILWTPEGQADYAELVGPHLRHAREQWLDSTSQVSMSVLLSTTNEVLCRCATKTNEFINLGKQSIVKSKQTPTPIRITKDKMNKAHKSFKLAAVSQHATLHQKLQFKHAFSNAKKVFRKTVKQSRLHENIEGHMKLDKILDENPSNTFGYLKSCRKTKAKKIELLSVRNKVYVGSAVCDGFYDSMSSLKQCDIEQLRADPALENQFPNYDHIMKLCKEKRQIPELSFSKSTKILERMKKNVSDFFSITALHYTHAGQEGLLHYNSVLNAIIVDVNNATVEELNIAHGIILHKGHGKGKTSNRCIVR